MKPAVFPPDMTAREYLVAESISPLGALLSWMSDEEWQDQYWAVEKGVEIWLETAPEGTLHALIDTYEAMDARGRETPSYRLFQAMSVRGIPALADLRALAGRTKDDAMIEDVMDAEGDEAP